MTGTLPTSHKSFVAYARFRFLKIAVVVAVLAAVAYAIDSRYGARYGATWTGYGLGTVGGLLILWLTWFGFMKRSYRSSAGRLMSRLSAHIYLGASLLVIATLHTGFNFGWNVHTLAYAVMVIVIASGFYGVISYIRHPRLMTDNRGGNTQAQMLARIATLNGDLRASAMTLDDRSAALVERSIARTEIGGSVWRQLSARYPNCATAVALSGLAPHLDAGSSDRDALRRTRLLLDEKTVLLEAVRRDIGYKARMEIWLYFHVPLSAALIAALIAHIVAVFYL